MVPRFFIPDLHLNVSSFRVVTILHPSVVWCLAMQLGVMRLHVLCFFLGSQCKLHLKHLLHTIRLGTPWWKMPLILSCQKDLLLQSAICMPTILAIVYAKNMNSENSSLPVNCNYVSLWITESQSYTWLLKSRTFLQWPTLLGHLFPTTNLFLSSLSTTSNITQKIYCQTVSYKRAWSLLHRITKYWDHQSLQTIDFHFPK